MSTPPEPGCKHLYGFEQASPATKEPARLVDDPVLGLLSDVPFRHCPLCGERVETMMP